MNGLENARNGTLVGICICLLLVFFGLIAHLLPNDIKDASKKALGKVCESAGVAGDCSEEIRKLTEVKVTKFGTPLIPSVSPSGRTTWIEYREWELKGYSDAYEEIRRANFGEIDADFSDLKSSVKETGVGRVGEVVNLKTPLDKMRTYVEAKQSLSGLEEPPTEFLDAFNKQKRNYNDTKEKIRETDLQIREALRQQSELVNLDDKIKSLQEEIRFLEGKTEPLDAELEVLRQKIQKALELQEVLQQESIRFSTTETEMRDIREAINDIDSDIKTATNQISKIQTDKDKISKKNEAILKDINKLKTERDALKQRSIFLEAMLLSNLELIRRMEFVGKCEHDPTVVLIEKLNVTQRDLISKLNDYKQKLNQVSKEAKEFTDKLGVRQQEAELERVRADLKRVQEQLDKIESQPGSVAAQLKALEDDIAEQNLLLAQFQSNKARQIKNQEPLLEIITTITATRAQRVTPTGPSLEELQARRDTLEATIRANSKNREDNLASARASLKDFEDKQNRFVLVSKELKQRIQDLLAKLNREMSEAKALENVLNDFIVTAKAWISKLENSRKNAQDLKDALEESIKDL